MKTLIIHHLEPMWEGGYEKYGGTSFDAFASLVMDHLNDPTNHYDRVILTLFEDWELSPEHLTVGLHWYVTDVFDYGYGWERDSANGQDPDDWAEGGSHSEVVYLPEWMRALRGEVFLCGAFDGECIEDMECALDALSINFTRIESLII